jgi:amino-acid N-acetyltransferase
VVYFGGEAIEDGSLPSLLHDFALLNGFAIRLVLVHGIRPQIDKRLLSHGVNARYQDGLRITDKVALESVKEAAGTARVEIEALLSMGLTNSPMAGAKIRVASGNFVTAKPVGVRDGVDFQNTGEVRRIDAEGIHAALDRKDIVLLSAVGYSPTGEIFNLRSEEVATACAIALRADKLILLCESDCTLKSNNTLINQLTSDEARDLLKKSDSLPNPVIPIITAATHACIHGVERVHCVNRHLDGGVLLELFTRDGVGTLISQTPFESIRQARISDVPGILKLVLPMEREGVLIHRSRERMETEASDYLVIERDGAIIGCAALHIHEQESMGELACLVLNRDYQGNRRGSRLVSKIEERAKKLGLSTLFVLTTQTEHWFRERGFEPSKIDDLPEARRVAYNTNRNSKVLAKSLIQPT